MLALRKRVAVLAIVAGVGVGASTTQAETQAAPPKPVDQSAVKRHRAQVVKARAHKRALHRAALARAARWIAKRRHAKKIEREQAKLVRVAKAQLGKPYVWGAQGPNSFDCSGFVWYVYRAVGNWFPRQTAAALERVGKRVFGKLHAGDIIVAHNGGHVVLYVGGGAVIHAPHSGTVVQYAPVARYMQSATAVRRILR